VSLIVCSRSTFSIIMALSGQAA